MILSSVEFECDFSRLFVFLTLIFQTLVVIFWYVSRIFELEYGFSRICLNDVLLLIEFFNCGSYVSSTFQLFQVIVSRILRSLFYYCSSVGSTP